MKAFIAAVVFAGSASAQAISTFDIDAEGWGTANDGINLAWESAIGNPAGSISADDRGSGTIWYYVAPTQFLGDQSEAFGMTLSFDILGIRGGQTSIPNPADVILLGANGDEVGVNLDYNPNLDDWTTQSVTLNTSADWRNVTSLSGGSLGSEVATNDRIAAVLADLSGLWIRGEFTNTANDSTALDNIVLVPAPSAAALLTGLATLRRRR